MFIFSAQGRCHREDVTSSKSHWAPGLDTVCPRAGDCRGGTLEGQVLRAPGNIGEWPGRALEDELTQEGSCPGLWPCPGRRRAREGEGGPLSCPPLGPASHLRVLLTPPHVPHGSKDTTELDPSHSADRSYGGKQATPSQFRLTLTMGPAPPLLGLHPRTCNVSRPKHMRESVQSCVTAPLPRGQGASQAGGRPNGVFT